MNASRLPALPCLCSSIRRASRAITQLYEDALRKVGLRATQFTILQALSLAGEVSQGRLGEMLAMDSTSLTRTLAIMIRQGWVSQRRGNDRRERRLRLTDAGSTQLSHALPAWEEVQVRLREQLGEQAWTGLEELAYKVTTVATDHALN
jgi:DNA-binding MarR family transcriptional regulator